MILVTGAAGFIGSEVAYELAKRGDEVLAVDNINNYYDTRLKYSRLRKCGITSDLDNLPFGHIYRSTRFHNLRFMRMSIDDKLLLYQLFKNERVEKVINLAAQVGVRCSTTSPYSYMQSNILGFLNILEACRLHHVQKLVFASSSSVYGRNNKIPFCEEDKVDTPISLYAASKKSNELMAHCYSKLYGIQTIGLRYFTVYGPWGRPDMFPMLLANALRDGLQIKVFNNGDMIRDFTYIDDIVWGTIRALDYESNMTDSYNGIPYEIYNIGSGHPVCLMDFIREMEHAFGKEAEKVYLPMQSEDVYQTYADTTKLVHEMGYTPRWTLHDGVAEFVKWYQSDCNPL